jgi:tetratricopeptide (TPR) repeat protein
MARRKAGLGIFLWVCLGAAGLCYGGDRNQNWIEVRSPHFVVYCNGGEREGRHVAQQFENMRTLFHTAFPKLHVDLGKPTMIFALRNEDSLKLFIPGYGSDPKSKRLGGLFLPRNDMNFALVRTDISGRDVNEYHAIYHEYTHAIMHLNFRGLPLWLDEGFAEFFGSTHFEGNNASFGMVENYELRELQNEKFIPIETLVTADMSSPLYNKNDHSGMFYAESWAVVHYFMLEKEVRESNVLNKFLATLQATDDPVEAARQSFGDLKKLSNRLESYARQQSFYFMKIALQNGTDEKDFAARPLPPAEALAAEASFLIRAGHTAEALADLHEAENADTKVSALHDALGYYHFMRSDYDNATKEYDQAIALNPNDAAAYYQKAQILNRQKGYTKESTPEIRANLEKAVALDPNFAPTHAFLCIAYTRSDETKIKAIAEAKAAIALEPGNLNYFLDLGRAALANGKTEDAKLIAERAQRVAATPLDRALATSFARRVANGNDAAGTIVADGDFVVVSGASNAESKGAAETKTVEGQITETICGKVPEVLMTVSSEKEQMLLHVADVTKVKILVGEEVSSAAATPCAQWKDRKAKVTFEPTAGAAAQGEIRSIAFF